MGLLAIVLILLIVVARKITHTPQYFSLRYLNPYMLFLYVPHSYLQEFIARGVSQTLLVRFLDDKRGFRSATIIALIFADIHVYISWLATAVGAFLFGVLFGLIYLRQKNLIGVTLVHLAVGTAATLFGILY